MFIPKFNRLPLFHSIAKLHIQVGNFNLVDFTNSELGYMTKPNIENIDATGKCCNSVDSWIEAIDEWNSISALQRNVARRPASHFDLEMFAGPC